MWPTDSTQAAVDLLLLQKAAASIVTAFSSLTVAVYSRRCCLEFTGQGHNSGEYHASALEGTETGDVTLGGIPGVMMYDVYNDGSLTGLAEYPCGYKMGEEFGYLTGAQLKSPPNDIAALFNPNLNEKSPLFTNATKNKVRKRLPTGADVVLMPEQNKGTIIGTGVRISKQHVLVKVRKRVARD